jgi:hypothetical protein
MPDTLDTAEPETFVFSGEDQDDSEVGFEGREARADDQVGSGGSVRGDLDNLLDPHTEDPEFEGYDPLPAESDPNDVSANGPEYHDEAIMEGPYIEIRGEPFHVRRENGRVIISHDQWSLIGYGDTLVEAEQELFNCARRLSVSYLDRSLDEMTLEAVRMRNFIAEVVSYAELP